MMHKIPFRGHHVNPVEKLRPANMRSFATGPCGSAQIWGLVVLATTAPMPDIYP